VQAEPATGLPTKRRFGWTFLAWSPTRRIARAPREKGIIYFAPGGGNTTERLLVIDEERLLPAPYHRSLLRTGEQVVVS
jgi:hypothetical protein